MKGGTTELMKFKRLERSLGESRRGVVGLLELLWQGAARNSPRGDIGKFDNEEIAILCDWEGDPDLLVEALVRCGWLDESDDHRLVVHDWEDHAPNYVKGNLKSHGRGFAQGSPPKQPALGGSLKQPALSVPPPSLAKPSQAKPNLAKPVKGHFVPPTVAEVREYCREKKYTFDPELFIAHNQARGWKLSRGLAMKCWKSACATWEKNKGKFDDNGRRRKSGIPKADSTGSLRF